MKTSSLLQSDSKSGPFSKNPNFATLDRQSGVKLLGWLRSLAADSKSGLCLKNSPTQYSPDIGWVQTALGTQSQSVLLHLGKFAPHARIRKCLTGQLLPVIVRMRF